MFKKLLFLTAIQIAFVTHSQKDHKFMNFVENHFSAGYGAHVLTILPGPHAKAQFYPINRDRFKLYGEVRGELCMAPIFGFNYNIQGATRITENFGFHGGFGRWNYISALRNDPETEPMPFMKVNSFEFGVNWLGHEDAVLDIFASIPLSIKETPIFIVGGTITLGYVWWNRRDEKLPRTES